MAPQPPGGMYTFGLVSIYVFPLICGVLSMTRELPFGLVLCVWYGLVYRRWNLFGLLTFAAAQVLVAVAVVAVLALTNGWTAFGHFFTTVRAPALAGVLAALAIALGLGGFSTIRRATI